MKKIVILLLAGICTKGAIAQGGSSFGLSYSISFPMGDLNDYINEVSYRGVTMEWYKHVKHNMDAGLEVGWNVFYAREDSKTYTSSTASISGVQYRYTNAVPMIAAARWKKPSSGNATPYAGLGLGVLYVDRSTDFGLYRISTDAWQFCIRPELGVLFKLHSELEGMLGVKYYWPFNTSDLDGQPYLSINIGLVFSTH